MNHRNPNDLDHDDMETLYIIPFVNYAVHTTLRDEAEMWADMGYDVIETRPLDVFKALADADELNLM
ncbi:hypothetical protein M1M34_gp069 [Haloarcula tailed virus 2]|uniref:Uncharacterized protein n=1 Tax=Haloarcula tailed virus 2 TaxID=2877989 RepID=A0AAE8Y003_9CAUD|nr:hypothetical protein M1M34_gp069 [Haloarcula tailed virus 2]UBF23264.1 hypothetical protein HATV-2_gp113 [Haloarcula tailed virus 2]